MRIGTRSVLYGAHCFFLHPWFVALAWWRLYGFPWDPRLWVAFFVHDLGYWGKPNMDGLEGESHPAFGARLMTRLFDRSESPQERAAWGIVTGRGWPPDRPWINLGTWGRFTYFHSRFLAKRACMDFSRLCVADKLAVALEPWWLYLPRVIATGEIEEYMAASRAAALGRDKLGGSKYRGERQVSTSADVAGLSPRRAWHKVMTTYCRKWALEHRDGRVDTWTPSLRDGAPTTEPMA